MSRFRLVYALAFFGILITTGGCSSSATAPEAATSERAGINANRSSQPGSPEEEDPIEEDEGTVEIESGYISVGN